MSWRYETDRWRMNVWLITIGEPLPIDGEGERLHRTGILAKTLVDRGHEVYWWSSSFDHARLRQRPQDDLEIEVAPGYRVALLRGRSYPRAVSIARIRNHREVAREFKVLAASRPKPDIIMCSFPSIELALEASEYGRRAGIPVVIDIRDMWPDAMVFRAPRPLQGLARVALSGMKAQARAACAKATSITGHAPAFVEWGVRMADRPPTYLDRDFPFGYEGDPPEATALERAALFWDERGVTGRSNVCFIGSLGHTERISTVIKAARSLASGFPGKFVICGTGDALERLRKETVGDSGILFAGRIGRPEIWTLMRRSTAGLACVKGSPDFLATIQNKVPEYLSAGLPIATNLQTGTLVDLIEERGIGFTYGDDPAKLAGWLRDLVANPAAQRSMSERALALYHERFVATEVYASLANYLENLARDTRRG